jgi:hypothetical protein
MLHRIMNLDGGWPSWRIRERLQVEVDRGRRRTGGPRFRTLSEQLVRFTGGFEAVHRIV